MKKLLAIAVLALLGTGAFAQIAEGTKVIEGSVYFSQYKSKEKQTSVYNSQNFSISLSPSYGYFLKENLELGIQTRLAYSKGNSKNTIADVATFTTKDQQYAIGLTPYLTKYWPITDKLFITTGASISTHLNFSEYKRDTVDVTKYLQHHYSVSLYSGLTYLVSTKFGLTTGLGSLSYSASKRKPRSGSEGNTERSNSLSMYVFPNNLYFGVQYFLNK